MEKQSKVVKSPAMERSIMFFKSERWKWIRCAILFLILVSAAIVIMSFLYETGLAEEDTTNIWVLCDPNSFVCVREAPRKTAYAVGGITCGTQMETDGKTKGNYIHVVNVHAEDDTGWISNQHIVYDEPEPVYRNATVVSIGRLAARKGVGGKVKKWLQPMDELKVYWWSSQWCLTNYGYVQSAYLELDGE